jgi:hypothetical protein
MSLFERPRSARALFFCVATLVAAGTGAGATGCGDLPAAETGRAQAAQAAPTPPALPSSEPAGPSSEPAGPRMSTVPGRTLRVDLRDDGAHTRGLQRQPDGTFRTVCVDAPEALRPRPRRDQENSGNVHGNDGAR